MLLSLWWQDTEHSSVGAKWNGAVPSGKICSYWCFLVQDMVNFEQGAMHSLLGHHHRELYPWMLSLVPWSSLSLESPGSLGGQPDRPEDTGVAPSVQSNRVTTVNFWMALEYRWPLAPRWGRRKVSWWWRMSITLRIISYSVSLPGKVSIQILHVITLPRLLIMEGICCSYQSWDDLKIKIHPGNKYKAMNQPGHLTLVNPPSLGYLTLVYPPSLRCLTLVYPPFLVLFLSFFLLFLLSRQDIST